MHNNTYAYSEIFDSIQGEGEYTGYPTAWLRFYLCNLQCNGFSQDDPTDPSTYKLPYKNYLYGNMVVIVHTLGLRSSNIYKRKRHQERLLISLEESLLMNTMKVNG